MYNKNYSFLIKEFSKKGKLYAIPKKKTTKKKHITGGSLEDLDTIFFQEDEELPKLKYSLQEVQNLHLKTPTKLDENSIHNFSGHQSGVLLWGERGVGKSGSLFGLSVWAYFNDWIVLKIPSVFDLTQNSAMPKDGIKAFNAPKTNVLDR